MKEVKALKASDGKLFLSLWECRSHEEGIIEEKVKQEINNLIRRTIPNLDDRDFNFVRANLSKFREVLTGMDKLNEDYKTQLRNLKETTESYDQNNS